MSSNLQNSIWPNAGGTLGQIKVQIPDGVTTTWPTGDALVHNFVFNKGKLVGFVDTKALIANDSKTTIFPYEYVNISLPSIAEGEMTYNYDQCAYVVLNGKVLKGDVPMEIITKKYIGCKTVADIKAVDPNYLTTDIIDGVWKEGLCDLVDSTVNDSYGAEEGMFTYSNLAEISSNLSSLENGYHMFKGTYLTHFDIDLSSLTTANNMFRGCYSLTTFSSDLSSLENGYHMFSNCASLTSLSSDSSGSPVDLFSLTHAEEMFYYCYNLDSFSSDLPNLRYGYGMFAECSNLKSFSSDLRYLEDGGAMFRNCSKLTSFDVISGYNTLSGYSGLSNMTSGYEMFYRCTALTSFSSDLHNLYTGSGMFYGCTNLTSFSSDLNNLTIGDRMFDGCKLDTASVQNIADSIKPYNGESYYGGTIHIGIGNSTPNEQEEAAFNKMVSRGWDVFVNGSRLNGPSCGSCCASFTTLDETGQEITTPIPYWAKPVPSDEQNAKYVDSEGNFYNILGAQFIYGDNLETYGMFTSLEDAAANMRLKKIGEEEIETA